MDSNQALVRKLGLMDYQTVWQQMQRFTDQRDTATRDEFWLLEHPAIFTLGQAGKSEHLLAPGDIPVIKVDRGGQVTYHGPGQLVIYLLLDLKRRNLGVRQLVSIIESSLIRLLQRYDVKAQARKDAPGVYVQGAKIAALGLRVRRGCSFHGLSLNVDLDLEPFGRINPCGYQGMAVARLSDLISKAPSVEQIAQPLLEELQAELGYNQLFFTDQPVGC